MQNEVQSQQNYVEKHGKFIVRQRTSALQKHFTEHGYLQRQKKSMQRESKMRNMQQESQRKPIPLLSGKSLVIR